ncbi:NAD(P)-binding protein [Coniochaeta ligniaria NRRL 30616]|uniref:NAD(P)-binding protein n=1 Tax=Coniochaeta ligniaria NRRL 30616 TaxID=1408157 RepID=A0A1J7JCB2_9PEZI|nr:NAD(P)-binding protein [Coniochaeta ligniaria NRRL 30616]
MANLTNWPDIASYVTNRHDTYPAIDPTKADLAGKSVFITGASKGCGRATAIAFARAGCTRIAVAARSNLDDVVAAVKAAARDPSAQMQVVAVTVDVTSRESMEAAAAVVSEAFGGVVDAVIANAGYLEAWAAMHEADPVDWWTSWEVNVNGVYLTAKYFVPMLLKSETRLFVAVSSIGAHLIRKKASSYHLNKFAIIRFIEYMQVEYADEGIVAVSVHPGVVKTDLALKMPGYMHELLTDTPELFADSMVWLADKRREWLGGRFVNACWDLGELESKKDDVAARDLFKFRMTV